MLETLNPVIIQLLNQEYYNFFLRIIMIYHFNRNLNISEMIWAKYQDSSVVARMVIHWEVYIMNN